MSKRQRQETFLGVLTGTVVGAVLGMFDCGPVTILAVGVAVGMLTIFISQDPEHDQ
jgi:hypothetical protein